MALPRSKFAFLTLPRYSMIALSNAVEPLRMANILTGQTVYEWSIVSMDGQPPASNGPAAVPGHRLEQIGTFDILFVCGGVDVQGGGLGEDAGGAAAPAERRVRSARCAPAATRSRKAGCWRSTAPPSTGRTCRRCARSSRASSSTTSCSRIDRDRFTCSGGVAPLDLMLHLVEAKLGRPFRS